MCLFPEENQQPVLGGHRFPEEKGQCFIGRETKNTHFYRRKINETNSLRSADLTIILLV